MHIHWGCIITDATLAVQSTLRITEDYETSSASAVLFAHGALCSLVSGLLWSASHLPFVALSASSDLASFAFVFGADAGDVLLSFSSDFVSAPSVAAAVDDSLFMV